MVRHRDVAILDDDTSNLDPALPWGDLDKPGELGLIEPEIEDDDDLHLRALAENAPGFVSLEDDNELRHRKLADHAEVWHEEHLQKVASHAKGHRSA